MVVLIPGLVSAFPGGVRPGYHLSAASVQRTGGRGPNRLNVMHVKKLWLLAAAVAVLLAAYLKLMQPCIYVLHESEILVSLTVRDAREFSVRFVHSVQKTPVIENFVIAADDRTIELVSTRYQSFGVGLPFLASEGTFVQEGEYFVLRDMKRQFTGLPLRTGLGTQLTFICAQQEYPLYQALPAGSKVDIIIAPWWRRFCI